MKSLLRLVALVLTISLRAAKSKAPIIARLRACPGASIRRSLPLPFKQNNMPL